MPRKKKVTDNETLSKETEKVQETLLQDLVGEDATNEITPEKAIEAIDKGVEALNEPVEVKAEVKKAEVKKAEKKEVPQPKKDELKVGDRVKLKSDVETDTLGRRIHNGIRNYTYTILAIRPDNFISIECLTYVFLVRKDQVNKV